MEGTEDKIEEEFCRDALSYKSDIVGESKIMR